MPCSHLGIYKQSFDLLKCCFFTMTHLALCIFTGSNNLHVHYLSIFTTKIKQKNIRAKAAKSVLELQARIILVLEVEMLAILVNMDT